MEVDMTDPRITELLTKDFELELYHACLQNAADVGNRLRLSNFAFSMRELMRHVLDRLAPNSSVSQCGWFNQEHRDVGKATGAQKAVYAVQGGLAPEYVSETLKLDVKLVVDRHKRAVRELSEFTHVRPEVFNLEKSAIDEHISETKEAIGALFEAITLLRNELIEGLWENIDSAIVDEALRETILAFDEAATHHSIDEVGTDAVIISTIDHEFIYFKATGWITAELQWGSNSDVRKGDGAIGSLTSEFECRLTSPVGEPDAISVLEGTLSVEEAPWKGRETEDDE